MLRQREDRPGNLTGIVFAPEKNDHHHLPLLFWARVNNVSLSNCKETGHLLFAQDEEELDVVNRGEVYPSLVAKALLIQRGEAEATRLGCAYSVRLSLVEVPRPPISTPFLSPTQASVSSRGGAGGAARSLWTCMPGLCPHQGLTQETTER